MNSGEMATGYNGPSAFSLNSLKLTGHIISEGDYVTPTGLSVGVYYADAFPLAVTLPAALDYATGGISELSVQLLISFFLTLAFLASAGNFLFARHSVGLVRMSYLEGCLCMLFLLLGNVGSFVLIGGANAGFEMIVILSCMHLMLGPLTIQKSIVLLVLSLFLPMFHFTAGVLYVSFLIGILLYSALRNRVRQPRTGEFGGSRAWKSGLLRYTSLYAVSYVSYLMLFVPSSLAPVAGFLSGVAGGGPSRLQILSDVVAASSQEFFVLNAISMAFLITVLLTIFTWLLWHPGNRSHHLVYAICMFAPLGWLALGFTLWMGVIGFVQRISMYVIYPTIGIISIGHCIGRRFLSLILVIVFLAAPLTIFIYVESPYNQGGLAVQDEESLSIWAAQHSLESQVIFTDLRLAGLLISQGHFYTVGISDTGNDAASAPLILEYVFYNISESGFSSGTSLLESESGLRVDLMFVSSRMSMDYPGIRGYDYTFDAAPQEFMMEYDRISSLNLVCDGGVGRIYYLSDIG